MGSVEYVIFDSGLGTGCTETVLVMLVLGGGGYESGTGA